MNSRNTSNANKAKAAAAYRIFFSPVFWYVEIDNSNNTIEKTPISKVSRFSTITSSTCKGINVTFV